VATPFILFAFLRFQPAGIAAARPAAIPVRPAGDEADSDHAMVIKLPKTKKSARTATKIEKMLAAHDERQIREARVDAGEYHGSWQLVVASLLCGASA
jgi:hypothetical protein